MGQASVAMAVKQQSVNVAHHPMYMKGEAMRKTIKDFTGDYFFLSNFYPCQIFFDGIEFTSTEAAYQCAKTLMVIDRFDFGKMNPGDSKRAGRQLIIRGDWEDGAKDRVMLELLLQKFSLPLLAKRLIDTGDAELIEGNTWGDTYWGVCKGVGKNMLGKQLMQVRDRLNAIRRI